MAETPLSGEETLAQLLSSTGDYSERVRARARALLMRGRLPMDRPAMKMTIARTRLPQLLNEARSHRPQVITSEDRASVVVIAVDDLLALVELTDPDAMGSSLANLPMGFRPTTSVSPRDDLEDVPDERELPAHAFMDRNTRSSNR